MNIQTETVLKLTRVIPAEVAAVFAAWTDPAKMSKWCAPEGVECANVEVDLTVGGAYHLHMKSPDGEYNARGIYKKIDAPKGLSYTWRWDEKEHDCGETLVTVEFNDLGGSTEIVLTHEGFPNAEAKDGHNEGWTSCLGRLEELLRSA
jgi:uncharacterized protein YndB with AHSA1/START domain